MTTRLVHLVPLSALAVALAIMLAGCAPGAKTYTEEGFATYCASHHGVGSCPP